MKREARITLSAGEWMVDFYDGERRVSDAKFTDYEKAHAAVQKWVKYGTIEHRDEL